MPSLAPKPIVYLSSTFVDLEHHRAALKAALEKCLTDVARADVYGLLLAHRYGYRPTEGPRLVFTVDPGHRPCRHVVATLVVTAECGP